MVTFSEFTTRLSRLGSVATDDGGFLQQLGAALVDRGKVKTWEKPAATGAQKGLLDWTTHTVALCLTESQVHIYE